MLKDRFAPLAGAVEPLMQRLYWVLDCASRGLNAQETEQLRCAAQRSLLAMSRLRATLAETDSVDREMTRRQAAWSFPRLEEAKARLLLDGLNGFIREMEHTLLIPAEERLGQDELVELKRLVGQVWGWIACDLQYPIWQQHPETAPSEG